MNERMRQWQRILMPAGLAAFLIFPVACATTGTRTTNGGTDTTGMSSNGTTSTSSGTTVSDTSATGSTYGSTGTTSTANGTTSTGSGTNSTGTGSTYGSTGTSSTNGGSTSTTAGTSFAGDTSTTGSSSGTTTSGTTSTGSTTDTYGTTGGSMTSSTTQDNSSGTWRPRGFYGSRGRAGSGGHMWGLTVSGVRGQFDNGNSSGNIGGNAGRLTTDFGNANGFGLGVTGFLGRMLAVDFGGSYLRPRVNYTPSTAGIGTIGGGRLRMIPLTALLQLHFLPGSFIDPYVGGGGAYMLMRNKTNLDTNASGVRSVSYDNRFGGAVQGGVILGFGGFGINVDAKYLPLKVRSDARFATGGGTTLTSTLGESKINPWLFSVGLSFGF